MNHKTDNRLLADVMAEGAPADFREAMLGQTLRVARRRRHEGQAARAMAVIVLLICAMLWGRRDVSHHSPAPLALNAKPPYELIVSQPWPTSKVVSTEPFFADGYVTASLPVAIIETSRSPRGFMVLNDDQLLALVSARPAILVRLNPTSERLVFVNPEDEKGFPAN